VVLCRMKIVAPAHLWQAARFAWGTGPAPPLHLAHSILIDLKLLLAGSVGSYRATTPGVLEVTPQRGMELTSRSLAPGGMLLGIHRSRPAQPARPLCKQHSSATRRGKHGQMLPERMKIALSTASIGSKRSHSARGMAAGYRPKRNSTMPRLVGASSVTSPGQILRARRHSETQYASYECTIDAKPDECIFKVGSKPAGDGKFGQADLGGNMWEWTLAWEVEYQDPCNDCANLSSNGDETPARIVKGCGFGEGSSGMSSAYRGLTEPTGYGAGTGFRCARNP